MSRQTKNNRFGYLSESTHSQEQEQQEQPGEPATASTADSSSDAVRSVPKGQGRMNQQRTQLNVRIPTALKRQATAKAVLEGRDIGEVVEHLLREYIREAD